MTPSPLRIALVTYSTQPRGGVIHTVELATALEQRGHRVGLYALDKGERGFGRPVVGNCHLVPAKPVVGDTEALIRQRIQELVAYLELELRQCPHLPYDCFHAQDCLSANALLTLRDQGLIPQVIRTVHHIEAFVSPYLQACQERSIREVDCCLCVSEAGQREVQQRYGIQAARVLNGLNRDRFSAHPDGSEPALCRQFSLGNGPIYLTVGGIEPRKNSLGILKAFAQVLQVQPTAQWVIAGGATLFDYQPYREQFFALVAQLGIRVGESLILPGVISDQQLAALYRCADGFVFPSLREGWGLTVLEAIASGLPVITSHQPPFTEFLGPHQALLVDPYSAPAIAQAMLHLLNPTVASALVRHSQSLSEIYTWEHSATMHEKQYRQLLPEVYYA